MIIQTSVSYEKSIFRPSVNVLQQMKEVDFNEFKSLYNHENTLHYSMLTDHLEMRSLT